MARLRQIKLSKALGLILTIFWMVNSLSAKTSDYLLDVWTSDDGLPDSSVTSIAQTPDGYLWVGTYNGLARFDGVRFVTFDPNNTPALKSARVTGLFVDARGTLWINTDDGSLTSLRNGVFNYEWQAGQVASVFSASDKVLFALSGDQARIVGRRDKDKRRGESMNIPLAGNTAGSDIKQDRNGNIWYVVNHALYRMIGTNSERLTPDAGYRGTAVTSLSTDGGGRLWIGTDQGIARWNDDRFEDMTPTNGEANVNVSGLYGTPDGCWVFANDRLRKCVEGRWAAEADKQSWEDFVGQTPNDFNAHQDRTGGLWFTRPGSGLLHVKADGETELFTDNELPTDLTSSWLQDAEGDIWVGLIRGGLVRIREKMFQVIGPDEGLGGPGVSTVCEDALSNIWIGTFSGGLYCWQNGKLKRFELPEGENKDCFFSACPDSKDRIWLSAGQENLFLLQDGKIVQPADAVQGITAILADKQGRVWLGKRGNLACLAGGVLRIYTSPDAPTNVTSLAEDSEGDVWLGTSQGEVVHYSGGEFARYQPDDHLKDQPIRSLLVEDDGTVWAGTFRGGLLRFKDGKFTRYTMQDGLPGEIICQMLDDGEGNLWFGSHKGIFRVPKRSFQTFDDGKVQSLPCVSYGLYDGLPTLECSAGYQPACWRGLDGRLWFATVKGVVSVSPAAVSVNQSKPPTVIEDILVDGVPYPVNSATRELKIPPGSHRLDIRYTALSFVAPRKVSFRYQLEGLEKDWVDAGKRRFAQYQSLPPGRYCFKVVACNNDGIWNETGASLNLVAQPYLWQRWWFDGLAVLFVAAIVAGVARQVATRKFQRKLEQMKQQRAIERERERIAKDIHDDLGAGLTRILLQSALARRSLPEKAPEHVEQISATAHSLIGAMDEIVWAVDPENDTLDSLVTYAGKFVQDFAAQVGLRCRLSLPAQLPQVVLTAEVRHNLFLAVKEALNNIVKHARATEVNFSIKLQSSSFTMVVSDDGRGFDPVSLPAVAPAGGRVASGNGLRNLRQRLEGIGGACVIQSAPGKGTVVELTVMLQHGSQFPAG